MVRGRASAEEGENAASGSETERRIMHCGVHGRIPARRYFVLFCASGEFLFKVEETMDLSSSSVIVSGDGSPYQE